MLRTRLTVLAAASALLALSACGSHSQPAAADTNGAMSAGADGDSMSAGSNAMMDSNSMQSAGNDAMSSNGAMSDSGSMISNSH